MVRSLIDTRSYEGLIGFLSGMEANFTTINSNYSSCIICEDYKQKFMQSFRGKKVFIASRKVAQDLENAPPIKINADKLQYYEHDIKEEFYYDKVIQVDIKSAYASALYNDGFIRKDTFDYIMTLDKVDRLVSIGMLASTNYEVGYVDGIPTEYHVNENRLKNYFYYAVKVISQIMRCCKLEVYNSYIATWVDAIYIKYHPIMSNRLGLLLDSNGFACKKSVLYDFHTVFTERKGIYVNYTKETGESKKLFIPGKAPSNSAHQKRSFIKNIKDVR
jgi:hypothetical protein